MTLILPVLILVSLLFTYSNTPLSLALLVAVQSLLVSLMLYGVSTTSWLSFILVLVFLSGMMVTFIYVASLAANEFVSPSPYLLTSTLFITMSLTMLIMLNLPFKLQTMLTSMSSHDLLYQTLSSSLLVSLYSSYSVMTTINLIIILLIALIVVVKNSTSLTAPLRAHYDRPPISTFYRVLEQNTANHHMKK
nr:NADH dehydrogenase subunit 6 [Eusirus cf. giganteus clade g1]